MSILRYGSAILRSPEGDPASGGGGGDDEAPAFTDAQLKAIAQVVNSAVTSHGKRQPTLAEQLKGVNWGELLAPEFAKLTSATSSDGADADDEDSAPPAKKPKKSDSDKRIEALMAEIAEEKKARLDAEERRLKAEQDRRVDAAKIKLRTALQGKLAPGALEHAIDRLTVVQNRLKVDENGNATFKVRRAPYKGLPEEDAELSMDEALPLILAEEDMKIYLPAPSGGGGKNPGPRGNGAIPTYSTPANTEEEKLRRAYEREVALATKLNINR